MKLPPITEKEISMNSDAEVFPNVNSTNPTNAIRIGLIFLCLLRYEATNDKTAKKKLSTKNPISNPSDSKKANPAIGNKIIRNGATKQCTAQIAEVHIPSLSRFILSDAFNVLRINK